MKGNGKQRGSGLGDWAGGGKNILTIDAACHAGIFVTKIFICMNVVPPPVKTAKPSHMTLLTFEEAKFEDKDRTEFIRRTKTICILHEYRKGIPSKSLVRAIITKANGSICEGVFCVDALGSSKGKIIGHKSHFSELEDGEKVNVEIIPASSNDCAEWLVSNADPERQAFGHILKTSIDASEETKRLSEIAKRNLENSKQNIEKADSLAESAEVDRRSARLDRKKGVIYAISGFFLGALFDVGMLEEKFGTDIPVLVILVIFVFAIVLAVVAPKLAALKK